MRKNILALITYSLILCVLGLGVMIVVNMTQLTQQIQAGTLFGVDAPPYYRYMVILDGTDVTFTEGMKSGMDAASEDYSVAYELWAFSGEERREDILKQMDIGIESNVDGIIVQAFDDGRFEDLLIKAKRMGVPVITITDDVPSQEKVSAVAYNKYSMGSRIGDVLNDALDERGTTEGTIAILQNSPLFDQDQAFAVQEVIQNGYTVRPISLTSYSDLILNAEELATYIIEEYDDLVAFICLSGKETLGVVSALKDANLVDDVVIIGSDDDQSILDFIRRGVLEATIVADVENIGYHAVWDMTKHNDGHFVSQYRDIPVKIVNGDNLDLYLEEVGEGQ